MKTLYALRGIVTVLNTPFDHNDQVDLVALARNVEEALLAGVAGFLVPAMASEVGKLSHAEKFDMVGQVLQTVDGKVPVFVGTAAGSVDDSAKLMKSYLEIGCRNVLVQLPFSNDRQFKKDFYQLADLGPEVIMLQDWDASGYGLPDDLIMDLFETVPAFRCLKVETVPAGIKYSKILKLSQGRLHVSGGWAVSQMPEGLHRGVHAFMPTGMHWIYTAIYRKFLQGKEEHAVKLFNEILPVLAFSNQHLDISIHFFKRLIWKQGIYATPFVREPILPFDDFHIQSADALIQKVMDMEKHLKSII